MDPLSVAAAGRVQMGAATQPVAPAEPASSRSTGAATGRGQAEPVEAAPRANASAPAEVVAPPGAYPSGDESLPTSTVSVLA